MVTRLKAWYLNFQALFCFCLPDHDSRFLLCFASHIVCIWLSGSRNGKGRMCILTIISLQLEIICLLIPTDNSLCLWPLHLQAKCPILLVLHYIRSLHIFNGHFKNPDYFIKSCNCMLFWSLPVFVGNKIPRQGSCIVHLLCFVVFS